ncbi:hypothetical protein XELAEV_18002385mg [Xenopus laevis]|uniref:Uncharacterized protein n=1 Tax=Xenopus laevis TaxID=8355 RepID=A0A974GYC4_XENLA|nr:hypothetical protein XELAEV_18002385mg [Xenopus laevis]
MLSRMDPRGINVKLLADSILNLSKIVENLSSTSSNTGVSLTVILFISLVVYSNIWVSCCKVYILKFAQLACQTYLASIFFTSINNKHTIHN